MRCLHGLSRAEKAPTLPHGDRGGKAMIVRLAGIISVVSLVACVAPAPQAEQQAAGSAMHAGGLSRGICRHGKSGGPSDLPKKISALSKAIRRALTHLPNASERQWSSKADRTAAPIAGALIKFAYHSRRGTKSALPLFISQLSQESARIRPGALPVCTPGPQPLQILLGHWSGRRAYRL